MEWIALLRGINVGGNRKIAMADLRSALETAGFHEVRTYIQSGNAVFKHDGHQHDLVQKIQQVIAERFGFEVHVVVRSAAEWREVLQTNPFADQTVHLHVAFLASQPQVELLNALEQTAFGEDRWEIRGNNLYLFYPNGTANAQLTHAILEKKLKVSATVRNWRTVQKLGAMLS